MLGAVLVQMGYHSMEIMDIMDILGNFKPALQTGSKITVLLTLNKPTTNRDRFSPIPVYICCSD